MERSENATTPPESEMQDAALGYVTDAGYANTFFKELSPAWLNYVARLNGAAPKDLAQHFTYLELGCGFGGSAIVNAGSFPCGEFYACDLNPAHVRAGAAEAAALGIANLTFYEASFDRLLSLALPEFDFITLHGVYSWVDADARQAIRQIIHKTLKPGGFLYVSYNCLPGWSIEAPLRRLLVELARTADGGSAERADAAMRAVERLARGRIRYFTTNPSASSAVESFARRSGNYLAHEFLNRSWEPFYSIDVAEELDEADVHYIGSATLVENHLPLVIDAQTADEIAALPTGRQQRLVLDFAINQRFRRDMFARRAVGGVDPDAAEYLLSAPIGSAAQIERIGAKALVPRGEITFQSDFINDLRSLMQGGSMTIGEAAAALGGRGRNEKEIVRNLTFLVAAGTLMPFARAHRNDPLGQGRKAASKIVEHLLAEAVQHRAPRPIPCEILGSGVQVRPIEALALRAWLAGAADVDSLAARLEDEVRRLDLKVDDEGRTLQHGPELSAQLRVAVKSVVGNTVPNLTRLGLLV
jgi:SAM-dependent methyltransferase